MLGMTLRDDETVTFARQGRTPLTLARSELPLTDGNVMFLYARDGEFIGNIERRRRRGSRCVQYTFDVPGWEITRSGAKQGRRAAS